MKKTCGQASSAMCMPVLASDDAAIPRVDDGFVATPPAVVDRMVDQLFAEMPPDQSTRVLDPGCGEGEFIAGVLRFCATRGMRPPKIVGIERNRRRATIAARRFAGVSSVSIQCRDFLRASPDRFTHVVGNPPYVSILGIPESERVRLRASYESARGRFDLYMLFFEQALRMLTSPGRLVFVTPEKYLYTQSALGLRKVLAKHHVEAIEFIPESTFRGHSSYPVITVVNALQQVQLVTGIHYRDGRVGHVTFQSSGGPVPMYSGRAQEGWGLTLGDLCVRISAGVATGADELFVLPRESVSTGLETYAYPTIGGRQLAVGVAPSPSDAMLIPYDSDGQLLPFNALGTFGRRLERQRTALLKRSCVGRKPWYAFHDSLPFDGMLRPKLLTKDIAREPAFWVDRSGTIVPRHSVYYLTPRDAGALDMLVEYLSSPEAKAWLHANCQRAANDFLRVQSAALRRLPLPASFDGMGA